MPTACSHVPLVFPAQTFLYFDFFPKKFAPMKIPVFINRRNFSALHWIPDWSWVNLKRDALHYHHTTLVLEFQTYYDLKLHL